MHWTTIPADKVVNVTNIRALVHHMSKGIDSAMTADFEDFELKTTDSGGKWHNKDNHGQEALVIILGEVSFDSWLDWFGNRLERIMMVCIWTVPWYSKLIDGSARQSSSRKEINQLKLKFKLDFPVKRQESLPDDIVDFLKNQAHFLDCVQRLADRGERPQIFQLECHQWIPNQRETGKSRHLQLWVVDYAMLLSSHIDTVHSNWVAAASTIPWLSQARFACTNSIVNIWRGLHTVQKGILGTLSCLYPQTRGDGTDATFLGTFSGCFDPQVQCVQFLRVVQFQRVVTQEWVTFAYQWFSLVNEDVLLTFVAASGNSRSSLLLAELDVLGTLAFRLK
jgi:hypothetical protein